MMIDSKTCTAGTEVQCLSKVDLVVNVLTTQTGTSSCTSPTAGWACDTAAKAVQCCGDPDCQAAGVYCSQYGNRYAKCDPTLHTCTVCDKCASSTTDCASGYCCTEDTPGPKDATGKCVGPVIKTYGAAWLCV